MAIYGVGRNVYLCNTCGMYVYNAVIIYVYMVYVYMVFMYRIFRVSCKQCIFVTHIHAHYRYLPPTHSRVLELLIVNHLVFTTDTWSLHRGYFGFASTFHLYCGVVCHIILLNRVTTNIIQKLLPSEYS